MRTTWSDLNHQLSTWKRLQPFKVGSIMIWKMLPTQNIELEVGWPIKNNPPKLWCIKIEPKISGELIWDLLKIKFFGTSMRFLCQVHTLERVKLFNSRSESRKCIGSSGRNFLTMHKVCSLQGWIFQMRSSKKKFW